MMEWRAAEAISPSSLPAQVQGRWFYLTLILDLFSRRVVGCAAREADGADHAAHPRVKPGGMPCPAHHAARCRTLSRLVQPDGVKPRDVINAEVFARIMAFDIRVPDIVDLL